MNKPVKIISDIIYGLGVAIVLGLGVVAIFGSNEVVFPDAMIQYTQKELAFLWIALGTIPMLAACFAVYFFNAFQKSAHKKRNFLLLFLPGFICTACALFIIGLLVTGMINQLFRS